MKKISYIFNPWIMVRGLLLLALFAMAGLSTLWGQCTNSSAYGTVTAPTGNVVVTISTCTFAGEYNTINNAQAGTTYQFTGTYSGPAYLTVRQGTYNGTVLGFGYSPISVIPTVTGPIYLHVNTDPSCGTLSACHTTTVQCTSCAAPVPPPNDLCANAQAITIPSATTGTTVNATVDNAGTCVTTNTAPGVWYTFTNNVGNGSNRVVLNLCTGTSFDTKLSVYTGACGALACVTGNDDYCGVQSQVSVTTVGGNTNYKTLVHNYSGTTGGAFVLTALQLPSILNIAAGAQGAVDPVTCEFTQEFIVTYLNPSGNLVLNGQSYAPTGSPMTIVQTMAASGGPVSVSASFSGDAGSLVTVNNLFNAPECPCEVICPADIVVNLNPGACEAIVTYDVTTQGYCVEGGILTGFVGLYAYANWTTSFTGSGGSINTSGLPNTVTLVGPDGSGCSGAGTTMTITIPNSGPFSFNWSFTTNDAAYYDPPRYIVNGVITTLLTGYVTSGSGTVNLNLNAGDVFSFQQWSLDCVAGPGNLTISNLTTGQATPLFPEQIAGLPSGSTFPIGTTTNTWQIEDGLGGYSTCSFDVTVLEYPNPVSTLACNDNVQISLDETGCVEVGADMVLEGGPYGCYDDYTVIILNDLGFPTDNEVCCEDVGKTFTVRVTDPVTGNMCWGTITVMDKLPPIIECLDFAVSCTEPFPAHPHPEISIGAPPALLATVNGPNNGNSSGGMVWFDVNNLTGGEVTITELGMNLSNATMVDIYIRPGSYVGNTGSPAGWTLVGQADGTAGPFSGPVIGAAVITPCPTNFVLPAGSWGFALHALSAAQSYTNGTGSNQSFTDGSLTITLGSTANTPWGSAFTPRVWNGWIVYSSLFEADLIEPYDNCYVVDLDYTESIENPGCEGESQIITRTWTAVDQSGNSSSCVQTITRKRPTLDNIEFPPSYDGVNGDALDCSGWNGEWHWDANGNGYPDPAETGIITITGYPFVNEDICEMTATYEDLVIPICDGTFKVVRTWLVIDWCLIEQVEYTQIIKVADQTGPTVDCPEGPLTLNVYQASYPPAGPNEACKGYLVVPPVTVLGDDCSALNPAGYYTELWTLGGGTLLASIPGNGGTFANVELIADNPPNNYAEYTVRHVFADVCGNLSECIYDIEVIDKVPPVPVCDEITELAITNSGGSGEGCSWLYAEDLDDGSYDNCGDVYFYAAKMNPFLTPPYFYQYYKQLEFCCDELGDNMVIVLVLDFDPTTVPGATLPDGSVFLFPGNPIFEGSFNTCMVTVQVTDKIPPVLLFCPPNQEISCDEYLQNYAAGVETGDYSVLDGFGTPVFYDNCVYDPTYTVTVNINNCTEGTITRSWVAADGNGQATCTQVISVYHVSDWVVEFPADVVAVCTDGQLPDLGEPQIFFDECELIGVSFEDQVFTVVPDACYKIVRTWSVINWCIYEDFGYDEYLEAGHAECNLFVDWDGDGDQDCRTFRDGWNESGNPGTPDGYIVYKQTIKVIDNEAPDFEIPPIDGCIVETDCDKDIILPYPIILDDCSLTFDVDITGDFGTFNDITADVIVPEIGVGEYYVYYAVTDNCGNTGYQTVVVVVEDCKLPITICKHGLVVEIDPPGALLQVDVYAWMIDEFSWDNCGPVQFSWSPDVNDTVVTYTCADLGQIPVQMWVTDIYGLQDYCETFIILQDNLDLCGGGNPIVVAGVTATEEEEGVEGVDVQVNGGIFSEYTGASGDFSFDLPAGGDYTVAPQLDENPGNGVTTWDLVLISRHILGINLLDSPYKIIAADANKSNTVTTLDMVNIRKVILQIEPGFPNNTSWRFVDKDYVFPTPANPFAEQFPEVINYNNLTLSDLNADFVAIKVGDVNGSAATSANGGAQQRTFNGTMNIDVQDQQLKAGNTYTVAFTAEAMDLLGYQFTLNYSDAIEVVEVVEGVAGEENFGMLEAGVITTSWNESEPRAMAQGEVLFSLVVKANADVMLSEALRATSAYTAAEAYNGNSELLDVNLTFNGIVGNSFTLFQNVPNPFKGVTVIGFTLPEATTATLTVMDVSGKVLQLVEGEYGKGYNEVRLSVAATGVLYYQLDTPTHSATRKMVVLE